MRDGRKVKEIYGALYYACINNMGDIVESMLFIPTIDVNILYTVRITIITIFHVLMFSYWTKNQYTALQYTILKDIECHLAPLSSPNSRRRYPKIISMLMSHRKTIWRIADNKAISFVSVPHSNNKFDILGFCDSCKLDIERFIRHTESDFTLLTSKRVTC